MKITKRQLKRIIRQEKGKILSEARRGGVGIGFQGWEPNRNVDFARSYGSGAKTVQNFGSNSAVQQTVIKEQGGAKALGALYAAIDELIRTFGNEGAFYELKGIIEDWDDGFGTVSLQESQSKQVNERVYGGYTGDDVGIVMEFIDISMGTDDSSFESASEYLANSTGRSIEDADRIVQSLIDRGIISHDTRHNEIYK